MSVSLEVVRIYLQEFWPSLWWSSIPWDDEGVLRFWKLASELQKLGIQKAGDACEIWGMNLGNVVAFGDVSYTLGKDRYSPLALIFGKEPGALFYEERHDDGTCLRRYLLVSR